MDKLDIPTPIRFFAVVGALLALALGLPSGALAQSYPSRPVRIVIPFPPGGGIDVLVRAVSERLAARWGQAVIVDNRPGAGSLIGAEAVAHAAPDGYTLMATVNQTFTANRFLYKSLPYDPDRSFAPITLMLQSDHFLLAHPAVPAKNLRELVALAAKPEAKLNYGSFGSGSQPQLVYEGLNQKEKLQLVHIPYKGIAPLLQALTGGEVQLTTGSAGVAGPLLKAGRIKALAIAGKRRSPQFPDVPTTAEQGQPQLLASIWYGLFAPAGTPSDIVERIGSDVREILSQPAFAEQHARSKGLDVVGSTAQEVTATIRDETQAVGALIRAAGVQPE
jgi:tripartite-type tricarboxylate transporter receptor subunit TctC